MIDPKTGGPAFPSTMPFAMPTNDISHSMSYQRAEPSISYPGMTLRDYFAGQGLVAVITGPPEFFAGIIQDDTSHADARVAQAAYEFADAMLAERAKVRS